MRRVRAEIYRLSNTFFFVGITKIGALDSPSNLAYQDHISCLQMTSVWLPVSLCLPIVRDSTIGIQSLVLKTLKILLQFKMTSFICSVNNPVSSSMTPRSLRLPFLSILVSSALLYSKFSTRCFPNLKSSNSSY